jgi:hypothetical protein
LSEITVHYIPEGRFLSLRMKAINQEDFAAELTKLPLFTDLADDVNSFLAQYNSGLRTLLDRHAPLSSRTFTICPDNPWSNPAIVTKKRSIHHPERRWKRTGLVIDGQILRDGVQELRDAIDAAKVASLNIQIAENTNRMSLNKIVDTFLLKDQPSSCQRTILFLSLRRDFRSSSPKRSPRFGISWTVNQIIGHQNPRSVRL